jgi:hypothetical protein
MNHFEVMVLRKEANFPKPFIVLVSNVATMRKTQDDEQ